MHKINVQQNSVTRGRYRSPEFANSEFASNQPEVQSSKRNRSASFLQTELLSAWCPRGGIVGRKSRHITSRTAIAATASLLLFSCGGGTGGPQGQSTNPPGTYATTHSAGHFFTDNNQQGQANELVIENMFWGRLVDVYGFSVDGRRVLMHENLVIGKSVQSDSVDYLLQSNPVTGIQELTILRDVTDMEATGGLEQFVALLRRTQQTLDPVVQKGPGQTVGGAAGLFSMVPRNATIVLELNDLLASETVDGTTVHVWTGADFSGVFDARIMVDPNFGDLADLDGVSGLEFYSTRVLIDPTISTFESFALNPQIQVNTQGLPPSTTVNLANLMLRVPTELDSLHGQNKVLANPSGHALSTVANGAWDSSSGSADVVRAMRTGGGTLVTGDAYNGYLPDREAPRVVGSSFVELVDAPIQLGITKEFLLPTVRFESMFCSKLPVVGDVLIQTSRGIFADVVGAESIQNGEVRNVRVLLRQYPIEWDAPGAGGPGEWVRNGLGQAELQSAFDVTVDSGRSSCFLRVSPVPTGYPENPGSGIHPDATFEIRFSEPVDTASVTAFDSMLLTRQMMAVDNDPPLASSDFIAGRIGLTPDLQRVLFAPEVPLNHEQGISETYFLTLLAGDLGITDLAGNEIDGEFPAVEFQMDSEAASIKSGGRVSRFASVDEEPEDPFGVDQQDYGNMPEWGGQHLYDIERQLIRPRPVTRFTAIADRTQTVPALMTPFIGGLQTPLSKLGSKMQIVYRFMDFGWTLEDSSNVNVDISGVSWAPVNGLVSYDYYDQFEMRMSHSRYAPDEFINPATLWPMYPDSGLQNVYDGNPLDSTVDPQRIMHEKSQGYEVLPGNAYTPPGSNTTMIHYPLNQNLTDPAEERTYLWRDTALLHRAGPDSGGSPPDQQNLTLGLPTTNNIFNTGRIRTIGLPLLIEFRCFPDPSANGLNAFEVNLAANSSSKPYMRAFSTGGIDSTNFPQIVNPEASLAASGGYSPAAGGQATFGLDNTFYLGALDCVIRVSRSYSVWFPADDPSLPGETFANPRYGNPILEPRAEDQPLGTSLEVHFRGALGIENHPLPAGNLILNGNSVRHLALANAQTLDIYGDHYSQPLLHNPVNANQQIMDLAGNARLVDDAWRDELSEIDGARYYQVRVTFRSNIVSNETPELSALAVSWRN